MARHPPQRATSQKGRGTHPFDTDAASVEQAPGGIAHETGELHRLLVASLQDYAIFALDPQGFILSWNAGAERFKGYTADEIIGKHFSIFYPPEKQAEHFPEYELEVAAREGRFEDEGWRVRKDGSCFWANVVITALRNPAGKLVGFGKVTRDLTERRAGEQRAIEDAQRVAAEEAARRAADHARARSETLQALTSALAAAHTISEMAHVIFTDGFAAMGVDMGSLGVIDASGEVMELLAEHGCEVLSSRFPRVALSENVPMTEAIRTENVVVCRSRGERDVRFPAVAERLAAYEVSVVMPLATRGPPMGALALHQRSAASPTPDTLAFMESFAQQCAQALERAKLYEAERRARQEADEARGRAEEERVRAEEANRAKMEFLAAMSHELRTPLNAIGGYAQLLELGVHGSVNEEQRESLIRIRRSQQHLLGIINDILNFSRIDAGQITYDLAAVPVHQVLESVRQMIAPLADAKGLTFEILSCPPDAVAWADRAKTEQILLNLLSNAVKFTPHGGRVTLWCERADVALVALTVRDTGIGIPTDQLERIFEPFVQAGRSLTETREGAGLGLAISRDLARAMGGELRVVSSVGEGSAFTLVLPDGERPAALATKGSSNTA